MSNDTPLKKCSKCGVEYPATTEYFHRQGSNLRADCVYCARAHQAQWRQNNREKLRAYRKAKYAENPERGRNYTRKHRQKPEVQEHEKAYRTKYYQENKDHLQAYGRVQAREWRSDPDNQRRMREWRQTDEFKDYNRRKQQNLRRKPEFIERIRRKQHTPEFRQKARIHSQRRRTRKHALPEDFTTEDWQRALDYFNGCCAVCGRQLDDLFGTHTAHADHWIPLSSPDCPGTVRTNIIPLCGQVNGCNNSKSDKQPEAWLTERFGKRRATEIKQQIEHYFDWVINQ